MNYRGSDPLALADRMAYLEFRKVFRLTRIMRQEGTEQQQFRNCLANLATGQITECDYAFLSARFLQNQFASRANLENAIRLISLNSRIFEYNMQKLTQLGKPVALIRALHNDPRASTISSDKAQGLSSELLLAVGSRVILRQNIFTAAGLCNGTVGEVVDIVYDEAQPGNYHNCFPLCIMVKFPSYNGPQAYTDNVLPIPPVTVSFREGAQSYTRKQFPLQLAYAISIHRSQGLTLNQVVVDIGTSEFALGMIYVAMSRPKTIEGLFIDPGFSFERLEKVNNKSGMQEKQQENNRLDELSNN